MGGEQVARPDIDHREILGEVIRVAGADRDHEDERCDRRDRGDDGDDGACSRRIGARGDLVVVAPGTGRA